MEICIDRDAGRVDFGAPVWMSKGQRERFITFMKTLVPDIEVVNVLEKEKEGVHAEGKVRSWEKKDYVGLIMGFLRGDGENKICSNLNRSDMSVIIKAGEIVPEFLAWEEKHTTGTSDRKERIEKFLDEKGIK